MYQKQGNGLWKHLDFILLDIIVLELSFVMGYILRHGIHNYYLAQEYMAMGGILALIQLVLVTTKDSYKDIIRRGFLVELKSVLVQNTLLMLCVFAFMFLTKQQALYSRVVFMYTWGIGCMMLYVERILWKRLVRSRLKKDDDRTHMLVICEENRIEEVIDHLLEESYHSYKIIGAVLYPSKHENAKAKGETVDRFAHKAMKIHGVPIVAKWDDLYDYAKKEVIDEVFLSVSEDEKTIQSILQRFLEMGITVHLGFGWSQDTFPNQIVQKIGKCSVITTSIKTANVYQMFAKRLMDIAGSVAGLFITGILYLILAPIIKKQSPGPVFFSQERIGRNGRRFYIYKFRSMYMDAEERKKELMQQNKMSGFMFKMDDDPRIIPIGKIIRKYSLDEFPQFWNVLKGDMSLVGTRPPTVDEFEQYEGHHKVRLSIKPGLTGMWQVSGRSDITDFEEVVRLDNQYIAQWNLRLDIKILLKTVAVVLKSEGSV